MPYIERIQYIQSRVESDSTVRVHDLARILNVSPITIRRDLKSLEEQGKLTRVYGGAVLPEVRALNFEERYDDKMVHEHGAKVAMAHKCIELISADTTILIDSGTSTFNVACLLRPEWKNVVITYDLRIATKLIQAGIQTYVTGGEAQSSTGTLFGPAAEDFIDKVHADIGIVGVAGITPEGILYTPTMGKSRLKQCAMRSSRVRVLLADSVKFNVSSLWKICSLSEFDYIITNADFSADEWDALGVEPGKVITASV